MAALGPVVGRSPGQLILTPSQWEMMLDQVNQQAPDEACGLIAGANDKAQLILPVTNRLHSPTRFRMDPAEQLAAFQQIEAQGLDLLAIYHSHPGGPQTPSPTDLGEHYYPEALALIWSREPAQPWRCRAFQIEAGQASEVDLRMTA